MFIIRTAFWLALVVFLLPSDKESRERLTVAAGNVYQQLSTACERHPEACDKGAAAWGMFKVQAQAAGRIAFDIAMDKLAPKSDKPGISDRTGNGEKASLPPRAQPAVFDARQSAPRPSAGQQGTLRDEDLAPRWRGDQARSRL